MSNPNGFYALRALLVTGACLGLAGSIGPSQAAMPSTLRPLSASYQLLAVGTSTAVAVELMGPPKTRQDVSTLGISRTHMTWVDIAQVRYSARFVADLLVSKEASSD